MKITRKDIESMQNRFRATFINSISGYKSLNLVGTRSANGISNLAPFNSIIHIGSNPPLIGMIVRPQTEEHQTLQNIKDTLYYTLNHVQESFVAQAHQSSAKYDANTSEFTEVGLTELASEVCDAPYVEESELKMCLKLVDIIPIPQNGTSLVIGEIQEILIGECNIEEDGYVHIEDLGSITSLGLDGYYKVSPIKRFPYALVKGQDD
jgi:flavin reductase (DIM6/NTAB) family NADH-FMN oxidoreductase RutF